MSLDKMKKHIITSAASLDTIDLRVPHLVCFDPDGPGDIPEYYLQDFVDDYVTVCVTSNPEIYAVRNNFEAQISVSGKLEFNQETESYRVLINNSTYTYFEPGDVICIGSWGLNKVFGNGDKLVIRIKL